MNPQVVTIGLGYIGLPTSALIASKSTHVLGVDVNQKVVDTLTKISVVEDGDLVVLTKGMYKDKSGGTNMMKILRVGDTNY